MTDHNVAGMNPSPPLRIGCCITPHGFGHAARTAAVLEALSQQVCIECVLVTKVPQWFFRDSLSCRFTYSPIVCDIGLVQTDSLNENLEKTVSALDDFYPVSKEMSVKVAELFAGCDLILCDIAPVGILAAQILGIPSVLLENFTWDWIYEGYVSYYQGFDRHIKYLQKLYRQADYRIQTVPLCQPSGKGEPIAPISRAPRNSSVEIRRRLRIGKDEKLVLVTMGGVKGDAYALEPLAGAEGYVFALGGCEQQSFKAENIHFISQKSEYYHPDLVTAADIVVGKAGYSTLAEVYNADACYGYILRDQFPESAVLAAFIKRHMKGMEITATDLHTGRWVEQLDTLATLERMGKHPVNGASSAARIIMSISGNNLRP